MARTFADLSRYQQELADRPNSDFLGNFLQGVQLPQKMAENQLAQQLQNAINLQKLRDLQNPQAALLRRLEEELTIKGALNPDLGITRAQPGLVGQTIYNPGALTQEQQAALPASVTPEAIIPTAAAGLPETPISAFGIQTGLNSNPNIPAKAKEQKINDLIRASNARATAGGIPIHYERGLNDELIAVPNRQIAGQPVQSQSVLNSDTGLPTVLAPKPVAGSKNAKGSVLTPNGQVNLMLKYGTVKDLVGDISDPKLLDANGNIDYNKLAVEVGNAERSQKISDLNAKENSLNPAQKKEIGTFISAQKDLENLRSKIIELDSKGQEPGFFQNGLAVMANNPSEGWFSSVTRQLANSQLNESTIQKEAVRSGLESAVTKALSGQAVSAGEAQRLTGLIPKADDTLKIMLTKLAGLEEFLRNRVEGTRESALSPSTSIVAPLSTVSDNDPLGVRRKK